MSKASLSLLIIDLLYKPSKKSLASMASSVFSFLCLAFLLSSTWEVQLAEAILFERPSKTWAGPCQVMATKKCDQQCREREHALHGACHFRFPGFACFCYFKAKEKAEVQVQLAGTNICKRLSKTWTGACPIITKNKHCDQQCREWEYAVNGGCHFRFPGFACFCYYNC